MIRYYIYSVILLLLLSCNKYAEDFPMPLSVDIIETYYGEHELNQIMIAYDSLCVCPIVVFVHGGSWNSGQYQDWIKNNKISFFTSRKIHLAAVNYRLSPNPPSLYDDNRIKHPDHLNDLSKALKWLIDNAELYNIDKNNIFLMGHSAGAHLVSLLATNERFLCQVGLDLTAIKGVISLDGGYYLTGDLAEYKDKEDMKDIWIAYQNAFTDDELVHYDATPLYHIHPGKKIPPFLLISGRDAFRVLANNKMTQTLNKNGYSATHFRTGSYEHSVLFNVIGTSGDIEKEGNIIIDFIKNNN